VSAWLIIYIVICEAENASRLSTRQPRLEGDVQSLCVTVQSLQATVRTLRDSENFTRLTRPCTRTLTVVFTVSLPARYIFYI
jgi:hypothetical protein